MKHREYDVLVSTPTTMPTLFVYFDILTEVWRSLPPSRIPVGLFQRGMNHAWPKDLPTIWVKTTSEPGCWKKIPGLYVRGDWRRWGCTSMSSPLWPQGVIGWEQWLALFACTTPAPHSSTLPPLHPVPHPAEDRVNSCLRSLRLAGTQSCAAVCVSPGPAGERLKLQSCLPYDSLQPEPGRGE